MTATVVNAPGKPDYKPPPPLVRFKDHPVRWTWQTAERLGWATILGHVFGWTWIALYFIVTQKNHTIKHFWDDYLVPWDLLRHFIRDYVESLLATCVVWFALFNRWSKRNRREKFTLVERIFDRIGLPSRAQQEPTHGWQYWLSLPLTVIASVPGAAVGFGVLFLLDRYESLMRGAVQSSVYLSTHPSLIDKYLTTFKADVPIKIAGVAGGLFFGRIVFNKVAGDGQRWFARRRAIKYVGAQHWWTRWMAKPRWWLPAPYRAEIGVARTELEQEVKAGQPLPTRSRWVALLQFSIIPVVALLAYYGWYIITTIAVHKTG